MMTPEEIKAGLALCDAATAGPWDGGPVHIDVNGPPLTIEQFVDWMDESVTAGVDGPFWSVVQSVTGLHTAIIGNGPTSAANAAFIAQARTQLPKALVSLTEAYAEIERLETRLHKVIGCAYSVVSPGHLEGCPLWAKLPTESTA